MSVGDVGPFQASTDRFWFDEDDNNNTSVMNDLQISFRSSSSIKDNANSDRGICCCFRKIRRVDNISKQQQMNEKRENT